MPWGLPGFARYRLAARVLRHLQPLLFRRHDLGGHTRFAGFRHKLSVGSCSGLIGSITVTGVGIEVGRLSRQQFQHALVHTFGHERLSPRRIPVARPIGCDTYLAGWLATWLADTDTQLGRAACVPGHVRGCHDLQVIPGARWHG